jgi:hypothetical protein
MTVKSRRRSTGSEVLDGGTSAYLIRAAVQLAVEFKTVEP